MKIVVQKSYAYRSLAIFYMSPLLLHSNTDQYNINGLLCTYTIDMLQPHFISCRGVSGAGDMRGSRILCQFYLVLSLFYSLQRGSKGFIAEKTIPIFYNGSRGGPLLSRGGCLIFSRGGSKC